MENVDIESFSVVEDLDPKKERLKQLVHRTHFVLSLGILIGLGFGICLAGVGQQTSRYLYNHPVYGQLLLLWFRVEWWMWSGPIAIFVFLYFYSRRWISNYKVKL